MKARKWLAGLLSVVMLITTVAPAAGGRRRDRHGPGRAI